METGSRALPRTSVARSRASQISRQVQGKVSGHVRNAYGTAKHGISGSMFDLAGKIEELIHDQPFVALLSAAAIGFLFARLIDR
jgi:ElaB/YqjD/DUF883 family membrane-anchored ribosome-binding protein